MFEVTLEYFDSQSLHYPNVSKIVLDDGISEIPYDKLLESHIPLKGTLYIHSDKVICAASCRRLKFLEIKQS